MTVNNKFLYGLSMIGMVLIISLPTLLGHAIGFPILCFMLGALVTVVGYLIFNSTAQKTLSKKKIFSIVIFGIVGLLFYLIKSNI